VSQGDRASGDLFRPDPISFMFTWLIFVPDLLVLAAGLDALLRRVWVGPAAKVRPGAQTPQG